MKRVAVVVLIVLVLTALCAACPASGPPRWAAGSACRPGDTVVMLIPPW